MSEETFSVLDLFGIDKKTADKLRTKMEKRLNSGLTLLELANEIKLAKGNRSFEQHIWSFYVFNQTLKEQANEQLKIESESKPTYVG